MYDGVFCFEAEDGIRDDLVTGVQTCALPISNVVERATGSHYWSDRHPASVGICEVIGEDDVARGPKSREIGRASCRERGKISVDAVSLKKKKTHLYMI